MAETYSKETRNKMAYYLLSFYAGISSITELAVAYHFKDYLKIEPSKLSQLTSLIILPWSLKPFLGLLSDFVPMCGYKRKFYILMSGFLSILCWLGMVFMEPKLLETFILLFCINIAASFSSVLGEAIVVELTREKNSLENENNSSNNNEIKKSIANDDAKDQVSMFMIIKYSGVLFASFMKGSLVETFGIKSVFLIGAFLPLLIIAAGCIMVDKNVNKININKRETAREKEKINVSEEATTNENSSNNDNENIKKK